MAVERTEEFILDLSGIVTTRLDSFVSARKGLRARQEADFQNEVLKGMSYEAQMNFRQAQLDKERSSIYPDQDWIKELESSFANLKKLNRYQKIRDTYSDSWNQYTTGKSSLDSYISLLESQLSSEQDTAMRSELETLLRTARDEAHRIEDAAFNSRITLAKQDRSISLLDDMISETESKKSEALLLGRTDETAAYDVTLQALRSRKTTVQTENTWNDMEAKFYKSGGNASDKLSWLDSVIGQSDSTVPIIINNVNYGSQRDFWNVVRGQYITGTGQSIFKDFLTEFNKEITDSIANVSLMSQWGYVPLSKIDEVNRLYRNLAARPEFVAIANRLETYRLDSISKIVDATKKAIQDETNFTFNIAGGRAALRELQRISGVDMTSAIADLENSVIKTLASSETTLSKAVEILAEQKGITPDEALKILRPGMPGVPIVEKIVPPIIPEAPTISGNPADYYKVKTATGYDIYLKSTGEKLAGPEWERKLFLDPNAPKPNVALMEDRTPKPPAPPAPPTPPTPPPPTPPPPTPPAGLPPAGPYGYIGPEGQYIPPLPPPPPVTPSAPAPPPAPPAPPAPPTPPTLTPPTPPAPAKPPTTLYEYYTSKGQPLPSVSARGILYEQYKLGSRVSYVGSASQNTALLNYLLAH